ncbi:hypothetical protein KQX54_003764 [Cotesia glomerata]|uniref:C2H2-type domain-containing protein n=1 Tax=Cotesia glomerata TaxID=32391 RepID=A0AAV7I518_COTGL|nr:hypothetical protein KQX54_003764 [Cotesia glomerata]
MVKAKILVLENASSKQRKVRVLASKVLVPRLPVRKRVPSTKVIENLELAKEKIIEATKKKPQEQREGSNRRKQVLTVRDDRFPCTNPGCGKTFKNQSDCNFHIKNRCNKPPRYKCVYCQYKTFHSSNVKRHIGQSHKGKEVGVIELYNPRADARVHVCTTPGCPKKYKYRCNLTTHLKNECGKPPRFKCFYCDFKNSYKHIIKKHSERKHFHEVFHGFLNPRVILTRLNNDGPVQDAEPAEKNLLKIAEERLICPNSCGKHFKNHKACIYHVRHICNKPERYKCGHCDYKSYRTKDVKRHCSKKHQNLQEIVIELYKPNFQQCLSRRKSKKMKQFPCPNSHCTQVFKSEDMCTRHAKLHCSKPPRFKCSKCYFNSRYRKNVEEHSEIAHKEPKLEINDLDNELFNPRVILTRLNNDGPVQDAEPVEESLLEIAEEMFGCPNSCGKQFKNYYACNYHARYICNKPERYKCGHCDYKSHWTKDVKRHCMRHHQNLQEIIVELYEVVFQQNLNQQKRKKIRQFPCPNSHCTKVFNSEKICNRHLKLYCNKPTRFKCSYCKYRSRYRKDVKKHSEARHKESKLEIIDLDNIYEIQQLPNNEAEELLNI